MATYATAGEGHRRASEAVAAATVKRGVAQIQLRDCLEGSLPWFHWSYTRGYLLLVRTAPTLWGALYGITDLQGRHPWMMSVRRWNNAQHEKAYAHWLLERQPDVIIATHFFPIEVATALKRSGRLTSRILCVITDWLPHSFWTCPGVDRYAVACEATRRTLIDRGIPPSAIRVTGIPIDPKFPAQEDRATLEGKLGLESGKFTLLIASGGFGLGPIQKLVKVLGRLKGNYQLLVVTGHNPALQKTIEFLTPRFSYPMKVYDFVHNMHELMGVSDLLISKPGGLTCAEAAVSRLPMVMVAPIPGQETRNVEVFVKEGAAVHLKNIDQAAEWVENLRQGQQGEKLRQAAGRLAQPEAADHVVDLALELS
ncbi:MAG: hypothetical protein HY594_00140 [Candidatus Omnitrophica bacterium]|nr:hypothetical protein [Candidatus Omnitrophota bacterium]